MPDINRAKSKKIMKLTKSALGILVRNITGHAHLARHNALTGTHTADYDDDTDGSTDEDSMSGDNTRLFVEVDTTRWKHRAACRLCKIRGSEETPVHLALDCPYTWRGRAELFRKHEINIHDLSKWEPEDLVRFFTRYNLEKEDNT